MEEKILELLGTNMSPAIVSSVLGISESRISQLLADETFSQKVLALRIASLKAVTDRDSKLDELEDSILNKLTEGVQFMHDPMKLLRGLQVVNAAKRRGVPVWEQSQQAVLSKIVELQIPVAIVSQFIVNGNNEVVEVSNRSLAPLGSKAVLEKLEVLKKGNADDSRTTSGFSLPERVTSA